MFQRLMEYVRKFRERGMSLAVDGFRAGGMSMDNASSFRALGTKPICDDARRCASLRRVGLFRAAVCAYADVCLYPLTGCNALRRASDCIAW